MTPALRLALAAALAGSAAFHPLGIAAQAAGSAEVRVHDIALHYQLRGAGEPLLLLHGFGGCGDDWGPFASELEQHYRLIIPDLRGHGASTNPAGTFTHRQAAADVLALLDSLDLGRVRAMGISTGGMTLLHMATRAPERIEAMVLIGATSHFPEQARIIMRDVAENGLNIPELVDHFSHGATRGEAQTRELVAQFGAFRNDHDDMNFTPDRLVAVQARTLIVHGDRDEFFPVDNPVGIYQGSDDSALWIVPNGDHVPIYGQRARPFLDVALRFLAADSSKGSSLGDGRADSSVALLVLEFDGARRSERIDLRPALPLVLVR